MLRTSTEERPVRCPANGSPSHVSLVKTRSPSRTRLTSKLVPPVSQTITSRLPVSASATVRAATGASDGPERTDHSGLSISSDIGTTPPAELAASSSPAKPSARRPLAISGRWLCIRGFNDASIEVPDARRYSRTIGLIWWESE